MAFNEDINLYLTTDKNSANILNAPIEKVIENTKWNKGQIELLNTLLEQTNANFGNYTPTDELNELLAHGVKGDKGDKGYSLEYDWNGTELGVRREDEKDFTYVNLKGEKGADGTVSFNELTEEQKASLKGEKGDTGEQGIQGVQGDKGDKGDTGADGLTTSVTVNGTTYTHSNGNITLPNYPTTANDVNALNKYDSSTVVSDDTWEIGQYLDMHINGNDTDYDVRLRVGGDSRLYITDSIGTYSINANIKNLLTDVSDLKNNVVNGKTSVANAINGKLGTSLSNQTSFDDMAYYIETIQTGINLYETSENASCYYYTDSATFDTNGLLIFGSSSSINLSVSCSVPYRVLTLNYGNVGENTTSSGSANIYIGQPTLILLNTKATITISNISSQVYICNFSK